jgi:hypothetical protein
VERSDRLQSLLERYAISSFYHVTPAANVGQIYEYKGLYSLRKQREMGIVCRRHLSNELSRRLDGDRGLDAYIHPAFVPDFSMMRSVWFSDPSLKCYLLQIDPKVILSPDVHFTTDIANGTGVTPFPIEAMGEELPLQDFYLSDPTAMTPELRRSRYLMRRSELLVPDFIPFKSIKRCRELDRGQASGIST